MVPSLGPKDYFYEVAHLMGPFPLLTEIIIYSKMLNMEIELFKNSNLILNCKKQSLLLVWFQPEVKSLSSSK